MAREVRCLVVLCFWSAVLGSAAFGSEMVTIPAGSFTMGAVDYQHGGPGLTDESPVHRVWLDQYAIDVFPVTNAEYAACVKARACQPPLSVGSGTRKWYFGNPAFDRYPVVFVHWEDADAYCRFNGKVLPTEAQWEKAARGNQNTLYPWGDQIDETYAAYRVPGAPVKAETVAVGSLAKNVSPYGVRDMAGNVLQWVRDWYDYDYYTYSPKRNPLLRQPLSPDSNFKVLRGGSIAFEANFLRVSARFGLKLTPQNTFGSVGFRCARE